jgi:hypothetical protein
MTLFPIRNPRSANQRGSPLVHILVDSLADKCLTNAQMSNAREIIRRLDPERFYVTVFHRDEVDASIVHRLNTRFIHLPRKRQTVRILREFAAGGHDILFYLKASPASKYYTRWRQHWKSKTAVGADSPSL